METLPTTTRAAKTAAAASEILVCTGRGSQDRARTVQCGRCKLDKPRTNYVRDKKKKNGLQSWCRACKAMMAAAARDTFAATKRISRIDPPEVRRPRTGEGAARAPRMPDWQGAASALMTASDGLGSWRTKKRRTFPPPGRRSTLAAGGHRGATASGAAARAGAAALQGRRQAVAVAQISDAWFQGALYAHDSGAYRPEGHLLADALAAGLGLADTWGLTREARPDSVRRPEAGGPLVSVRPALA